MPPETLLVQVHRRTGKKICVSEKKLGCLRCTDLPGGP